MTATPRARVFRSRPSTDLGDEYDVYGCLYNRNKRVLLTTVEEEIFDPGPVVLAGRYAAIGEGGTSSQGEFSEVTRVDLRSGKRTTAGPVRGGSGGDVSFVTDLEMKSSGSVAFVRAFAQGGSDQPRTYEVSTFSSGRTKTLSSGADVDPKSLALSGSILYWIKGGLPNSAALD